MSEVDPSLLVDVLKRAGARGATAADGFLIEEQSFSASVRLGQVDTVTHSREQRLALRVFSGRASAAGLTVAPVAAKDGEMQRDAWYSYARRRRTLEDPESIGRTAAARALRRLGARKVKTTEVPVIFDPDMAASLLRSIAGAASGPSLYRRASFLLERLGTRVAAPTVTIVDDGLLPGALGSRPFDGEGLATRRTVLVGEGKLESYLLDTYSGRKLGLTSTHHANRDGAGVSVGTTNLMLLAGTTPPAELIGSVKSGLYVTELIGFGVNGVNGDYYRGAAGLLFEAGRCTSPVVVGYLFS